MRILNKQEVAKKVGLCPVTIWQMEKEGKFPRRRQVTKRRVGWVEEEIDEWIRQLPAADGPRDAA